MQSGSLDRMKRVFWLCDLENMRTDINVQCPIEISIQSNPRALKMGLCRSRAP
jgi:hypothetical protein